MDKDILPHQEEYEQGILGAVLAGDALYEDVTAVLKFSDFYTTKHRLIAIAMDEMRRENIPIELITMRDKLEQKGELEKIGGSTYLTNLTEMSFMSVNLSYYMGVVKEDAYRRDVWFACHETAQAAAEGSCMEEIRRCIEKQLELTEDRGRNPRRYVYADEIESLPAPESLWADIIYPGGLVQLNAEPGIGKSTLAYNICALGALGKPFLDIEFKKKIKSLYIDLETPRQLRPNKIRLIAGELPHGFAIMDSLDLKRDFGYLLSACRDEKFDLLVLDTQSRALAMEQENDNSEANYYVGLLRRIASETDCAILLIHHTTKGEGGKAVYRGRGASAIAGAVDIVINIQAITEDTLKLSIVKHRIQGALPHLIIRKAGEDRFEPCGSGAHGCESGFEVFKIQSRVLKFLEAASDPQRAMDIVGDVKSEIDVTRRTIERAIETLIVAGKVQKVKHGYYAIANRETH